jgi:NOL1/NOP2/sun family putative RNA methylase
VRTGRIHPDELVARLHAQGFRVRPLEGLPAFYQVEEGPRPVTFTLEHWHGLFYVQQASTGVAAPVLAPEPGERVLDLCSAPGGKTTHAAELMGDGGSLVAVEVSEPRIRGLLGNVYRLGHPNIMVVAADGRELPEEALFDRVLVDAPCSGEGTLRRRGGRPPRQSASFGGYVTRTQEALLRKAIHVTRPGGVVLYVTCTFSPEENEAVVSRVLQDEAVELEPLSLPVPHAPGVTRFEDQRYDPRLEGAARIYPHHFDSGGLFLAKLRRLGGDAEGVSGDAWRPVPAVFPGEAVTDQAADELVQGARSYLERTFGVTAAALGGLRGMVRGGRIWLHGMDAWPLEGWAEGAWRPISGGFRAVEVDSRGRYRPTNDLLTWLGAGVRDGLVDVDEGEIRRLMGGEALPVADGRRGMAALRFRGEVVGRGLATEGGLRSEIPKARASDLLQALEREGAGGA